MLADDALFSKRNQLEPETPIRHRTELPSQLRMLIFNILERYVPVAFIWERIQYLFDPYQLAKWPNGRPVAVSRGDSDAIVESKRFLLNCDWFWVFNILEDAYAQLVFHEIELAHEEEEPRARPMQQALNDFFVYAGIGWHMVDGKFIARSDSAFERTVSTAQSELSQQGRITAADRISRAIRNLSERPEPDLSGAISHATGSLECVLHDVTGETGTLGAYLKKNSDLFPPTIKKMLEGLWGFSSEEGARHGREGVEPSREEAELVVAIAAAAATYLTKKNPRS